MGLTGWILPIVMILAAIGGVYNLLVWMGMFGERHVSNSYAMCPYCFFTVKPGDRIEFTAKGAKHLRCLEF